MKDTLAELKWIAPVNVAAITLTLAQTQALFSIALSIASIAYIVHKWKKEK